MKAPVYKNGRRQDGRKRLGVFLTPRTLAALRAEVRRRRQMGTAGFVRLSELAATAIEAQYGR